jgi:hypothetical protein
MEVSEGFNADAEASSIIPKEVLAQWDVLYHQQSWFSELHVLDMKINPRIPRSAERLRLDQCDSFDFLISVSLTSLDHSERNRSTK